MSLSRDNTDSWVRISHGSNKFVMDLNNNNTEDPEDQLEDQALQLDAKDFVSQAKAKAKPQRKELTGFFVIHRKYRLGSRRKSKKEIPVLH